MGRAWCEQLATNARAMGAMPYVVEGFTDISDAVRRGHAVLIRKARAQVATGVTIFEDANTALTDELDQRALVAILRFDPTTARYILQDTDTTSSVSGTVELTPRRLANYLAAEERALGVALGR